MEIGLAITLSISLAYSVYAMGKIKLLNDEIQKLKKQILGYKG